MSDSGGGTSRRELLQRAGVGAAALAVPGWLAGCGGSGGQVEVDPTAGEWKRYAGTQLNFISENTAPTSAIAANLAPFKELTGINVEIQQLELTSLAQRVALDFGSR